MFFILTQTNKIQTRFHFLVNNWKVQVCKYDINTHEVKYTYILYWLNPI